MKKRRRPSLARRRAAVKGWATRRAHALARRRAAEKGWRTRRAATSKRRKPTTRRKKPQPPKKQQQKTKRTFHYAGSTVYANDGGAQQLQFDITSNRTLTADDIDKAIRFHAVNDSDQPGIKIRIIAWFDKKNRRHVIREKDEQRYWDDLRNWILNADKFDLENDDDNDDS